MHVPQPSLQVDLWQPATSLWLAALAPCRVPVDGSGATLSRRLWPRTEPGNWRRQGSAHIPLHRHLCRVPASVSVDGTEPHCQPGSVLTLHRPSCVCCGRSRLVSNNQHTTCERSVTTTTNLSLQTPSSDPWLVQKRSEWPPDLAT